MKKNDIKYMSLSLDLAKKGINTCMPNPRVGCVIVKDDTVIGQGWHNQTGQSHAEVMALNDAGENAVNSTVYITLEPCTHTGNTPPCVNALIEAKVKKVFFAMNDPNPKVFGNSKELLQSSGIEVENGLLENESKEINLGFLKRMNKGVPFIRTKIAASLDGRTALKNGKSQWITSEESRKDVQKYRARSCGILTSISTILADNPSLNVRLNNFKNEHQPKRIILDSNLRIVGDENILKLPGEKYIYSLKKDHNESQIRNIIRTTKEIEGRVSLLDVIKDLGVEEMNEILIEAGSILNGAFLKQNLIDEIVLYLAPCFLGDKARGIFDLPILHEMSEKYNFKINDIDQIGPDIKVILRKIENV
ncbi:MAG: bifunctional diaminohydroxyphosphoribosylaminopyrimidine deaminase/5-amino-6-(5-phosphoribosylamino)uracil reductase RibD [Gammaproteobacteria bacterium]|nr:bifunctional diaminohydroxyphosphoribosylaminopyrimidine deaminase/5-amino-6-(5-phosphoribosylamino)uracil reductase RibD [Gammaproteobacteria bacterium]